MKLKVLKPLQVIKISTSSINNITWILQTTRRFISNSRKWYEFLDITQTLDPKRVTVKMFYYFYFILFCKFITVFVTTRFYLYENLDYLLTVHRGYILPNFMSE